MMLPIWVIFASSCCEGVIETQRLFGVDEICLSCKVTRLSAILVFPVCQDVKLVKLFVRAYDASVLRSLQISRSRLLREECSKTANRAGGVQRQCLFDILQSSGVSQLNLGYNTLCRSLDWVSMIGQCRWLYILFYMYVYAIYSVFIFGELYWDYSFALLDWCSFFFLLVHTIW